MCVLHGRAAGHTQPSTLPGPPPLTQGPRRAHAGAAIRAAARWAGALSRHAAEGVKGCASRQTPVSRTRAARETRAAGLVHTGQVVTHCQKGRGRGHASQHESLHGAGALSSSPAGTSGTGTLGYQDTGTLRLGVGCLLLFISGLVGLGLLLIRCLLRERKHGYFRQRVGIERGNVGGCFTGSSRASFFIQWSHPKLPHAHLVLLGEGSPQSSNLLADLAKRNAGVVALHCRKDDRAGIVSCGCTPSL